MAHPVTDECENRTAGEDDPDECSDHMGVVPPNCSVQPFGLPRSHVPYRDGAARGSLVGDCREARAPSRFLTPCTGWPTSSGRGGRSCTGVRRPFHGPGGATRMPTRGRVGSAVPDPGTELRGARGGRRTLRRAPRGTRSAAPGLAHRRVEAAESSCVRRGGITGVSELEPPPGRRTTHAPGPAVVADADDRAFVLLKDNTHANPPPGN
jgi:hypothetical protein